MTWLHRELSDEDERKVAAFMTRLGGAPPAATPRLTPPELLIVKAELLRHWEAERKVYAPLDLFEPFQIAAGLAAAVLIVFLVF
jgi:hypothetical protein